MWFKGEIFNGIDPQLEYESRGHAGLAAIRGAYACAFEVDGKTILVRDQFGSVPLYYYIAADGKVLYSDRVLDLLNQGVPRKLSCEGLLSYLTYGCVCTPLTMIAGVSAVPQGHVVEIDKGKVSVFRYWMPDFEPRQWTQDDAQAAVTAALRECVDLQMHVTGEIPAAFLSGGIDSSAIVSVMRQLHDGEIRTYCVRHDDDTTEESAWAQKVADCNHTKHTVLRLTDAMMRDNILAAISSYDQPTVDGLNFWFATKLVREAGESVIFSGEGGDELFAGYNRFAKNMLAYAWDGKLRRIGSEWWGRLLGPILESMAPNEKVRKFAALMQHRCDPYSLPRKIYGPNQVLSFVRSELQMPVPDFQSCYIHEAIPQEDLVNRISWLETQTVTPDMWLRDGYQTSCVHELTMRTPILDAKLAELLYTLSGTMKVTPEYLKPLLVRAAGKGMPLACATRAKMGFSLPFQRYFTGELKDMIDDFLAGNDVRLFSPDSVRKLGAQYHAHRVNWSRVWSLFVVEYWCKQIHVEI